MAHGTFFDDREQRCLFALATAEEILLDKSFKEDDYDTLSLVGQTLISLGSEQNKTAYLTLLKDAAAHQQSTPIRNCLGHLLSDFLNACDASFKDQHYDEIAAIFNPLNTSSLSQSP